MALGAYDATPLDMAGAYTAFSNNGMRTFPMLHQVGAYLKRRIRDELQPENRPMLWTPAWPTS